MHSRYAAGPSCAVGAAMMLSRGEAASQTTRQAWCDWARLGVEEQEVRMLLFPPNVVTNGYHIPVTTPDSPCHLWAGNLVSAGTPPGLISIPWSFFFTPPNPNSKPNCTYLPAAARVIFPTWSVTQSPTTTRPTAEVVHSLYEARFDPLRLSLS